MIRRDIESLLKEMMSVFPVVTITGLRQSGKTTLVRYLFPDRDYTSLVDMDKRISTLFSGAKVIERRSGLMKKTVRLKDFGGCF